MEENVRESIKFNRILIANRGEIAIRIAWAIDLGLRTVPFTLRMTRNHYIPEWLMRTNRLARITRFRAMATMARF